MNKNILIGIGAFVFLLIIIVVIVLVTGNKDTSESSKLTYPKEPVTLTYWRLFDDEDSFKDILQSYKEKHPNVTINYVKKDLNTYDNDLLNALAAGTGPDMFVLYHDSVPKHLDKLTPAPLGFEFVQSEKKAPEKDQPTQFKEVFVKATYDNLIYDNKIYGIPLSVDSLALYYNANIFQKTLDSLNQSTIGSIPGPIDQNNRNVQLLSSGPQNWSDFIEVVKLLTQKDAHGNITQSGVALGAANNVAKASDILSLLMMQNNAPMITTDKKTASFNLSVKKNDGSLVYPGTSALDFYTSFAQPGKETYTWNDSFSDSVAAFGEEKTAMIFHYSYLQAVLKKQYPNLKFEVAPMPQIKGITERVDYSYFWPEVVSKNTKYPLVAWDFLRFAAISKGIIKSTQTLPASPAGSNENEKPTASLEKAKESAQQTKTAYLDGLQGTQVFNAQGYTATNWHKGGEPQKIDEVFKNMIDAVINKNQPLQSAIDAAAASITNILGLAEPLIEREKPKI
ncbi:MAG: extracellular solute-binding protein [Candidatus Berkelbacteria bacterium]|nr:extracellular solute-binding protein [Candidatus Berkelbacteria bacterium]